MSKILAVFGATGQQGGSVINHVLNDPELSQKYKIRAITRDVNSKNAKQLKEKVEVVHGDLSNRSSLEAALTGAHTVFAMTTPYFGPDALETEYNKAKTIADVSVEKGLEYIIFSTLPSISKISGGKYTKVFTFEAKAKAEQYIRGLPIESAFYSPGSFMGNFQSPEIFLSLQSAPDGTWSISRHVSPKTKSPYIDAVGDTGKFIGAILAEPDKYKDKTFCAAAAFYNMEEVAAILSKAIGKTVIYKQLSIEDFKKILPFDGNYVDVFIETLSALEEFGMYGQNSEELVAWAVENARGKLSTLGDYLKVHPIQLALPDATIQQEDTKDWMQTLLKKD